MFLFNIIILLKLFLLLVLLALLLLLSVYQIIWWFFPLILRNYFENAFSSVPHLMAFRIVFLLILAHFITFIYDLFVCPSVLLSSVGFSIFSKCAHFPHFPNKLQQKDHRTTSIIYVLPDSCKEQENYEKIKRKRKLKRRKRKKPIKKNKQK